MSDRFAGPVRPVAAADVRLIRALATGQADGREPVVIREAPEKGEARLLAALLLTVVVWTALAVIGAVTVVRWLLPHQVLVGEVVFWLGTVAFAAWVCRHVNVKRGSR